MRKQLVALVAMLTVLSLATSAFGAGPRGLPHRYDPRSMDGQIQLVDLPDRQTSVAAWAYRSGAQYDIAISSTDANGEWSDPVFIGRDDGRDQVDPVIAADRHGNVYLAYTDRAEERVLMAYRPAGRSDWSSPWGLTPLGARAETPGMLVVGDQLVVAVRIGRQIQMVELPLFTSGTSARTINDSPDPIGYEDDDSAPDDEEVPSTDYSPRTGKAMHPTR